MEVSIAATRTCHHCPLLEHELKNMNIPYKVHRMEDHPDMVEKYNIRRSPVIIVDGKVVFSGMPSLDALRNFFRAL